MRISFGSFDLGRSRVALVRSYRKPRYEIRQLNTSWFDRKSTLERFRKAVSSTGDIFSTQQIQKMLPFIFQKLNVNGTTYTKSQTMADTMEEAITSNDQMKLEVSFLRTMRDLLRSMKLIQSKFENELNSLASINTLSLHYFLEHTESIKTPSWKRRTHMFCPKLKASESIDLLRSLLICNLVYSQNSKESLLDNLHLYNTYVRAFTQARPAGNLESFLFVLENKHRIENQKSKSSEVEGYFSSMLDWLQLADTSELFTREEEWNIIANEAIALPLKPAHIVATRTYRLEKELVFILRGTNSLEDLVTNANLDFEPFYDGLVHGGMRTAGEYIVSKYEKEVRDFITKHPKAKVRFLGHSMGAGAAVVASIIIKKEGICNDISVTGFGSPPLLSKKLADECKPFVTNVICDDDFIPRLTPGGIKAIGNELMKFDWSPFLKRDVDAFLEFIAESIPEFFATETLKKNFRKSAEEAIMHNFILAKSEPAGKEKPLRELSIEKDDLIGVIPGRVLHIYRDGRGFAGAEVQASMVSEINFSRNMIDDHTMEGYFNSLRHLIH